MEKARPRKIKMGLQTQGDIRKIRRHSSRDLKYFYVVIIILV